MSDTIQINDPAQLAELMEKVAGLKEMFSNAQRLEKERAKRGKFLSALKELKDGDLPFVTLNRNTFKNKSVASMRSQFVAQAKEHNIGFVPSLVEYEDQLILVNFDEENAAEKFNGYVLKLAGISEDELRKIAADLDNNTK